MCICLCSLRMSVEQRASLNRTQTGRSVSRDGRIQPLELSKGWRAQPTVNSMWMSLACGCPDDGTLGSHRLHFLKT